MKSRLEDKHLRILPQGLRKFEKSAGNLLVSPVQVNIGNTDDLSANKSITQHVEVVSPFEKQRRLEQIFRSQEPGSDMIVFYSTKRMCDQLARSLGRDFGAAAILGDNSQVKWFFLSLISKSLLY
ncbi:hypothetical protein MPTK1_2g11450 [Marchantia polymorpha subsp. ruderalis]|uniref:Helicase C-terminal domain-containing protein n=1 Tax=Marchantia polymorpha TaxID=3197 RepID=A0A2R6XCH6_MARPO|nr:hypothetical protein MARPO_0023s0111 [Marchantia polymorpha]BBN01942.1 hypothetical protein Mp_2g11450 [Marchantia polymorpha subsp. ruderalis]|eukprot:PTQ43804.1 hypothetical protein MARPO_0023s0111 [Marchantia polymorpha]